MNIIICEIKGKAKPMVFLVPDEFDVECVKSLLPSKASKGVFLHEILGDEINVCSGELNVIDILKAEFWPSKP